MREGRSDILEKRSELFQLVISAVIVAVAVNILSDILSGYIPLFVFIPIFGISIPLLTPLLPITMILFSLLWICDLYLGKLIIERVRVILLINKDQGGAIPLNYPPAVYASLVFDDVLKRRPQVLKTFLDKEIPGRTDPVIRDLTEWLIVSWLSIVSGELMTPNGRILLPPVSPPTSKVKSLAIHDLPQKLRLTDNIFLEVAKAFPFKIKIPYGLDIIARRYKPQSLDISVRIDDRVLFRRATSGERGRSEITLRGSRLTPLRFLTVRAVVERVAPGAPLALRFLGYTPVLVNKDEIVCLEKVVKGEELEELQKWIEIDCSFFICYRMRGYLFWHPSFTRWCRWAEGMLSHAKVFFDFMPYLKQIEEDRKLKRLLSLLIRAPKDERVGG
mgnify:CR=1 FL=1